MALHYPDLQQAKKKTTSLQKISFDQDGTDNSKTVNKTDSMLADIQKRMVG